MSKLRDSTSTCLLSLGLLIALYFLSGCAESSFQLSENSRLPAWFKLPAGLTRRDVSVTLDYYTVFFGDDTRLILKDKSGKVLEKVSGKDVILTEPGAYPAYVLLTVNGVPEVLEHRRMEPIFYVSDDPSVRSKASR